MVTTLPRPRPVALDLKFIARDYITPRRYGLVAAMSADGLWIFRLDVEASAERWTGEYLPTGDQVDGGSCQAVRVKAARPGVLDRFRAAAARAVAELGPLVAHAGDDLGDVVRCGGLFEAPATAYALARRRLAILDGLMVPGDVDGVCACGGYLVGELHADACPCCWSLSPGKRVRCEHLAQHQACATPDPARCEHYRCTGTAAPDACWTGDRLCCGCCDDRPAAGPGATWATSSTVAAGMVTGPR
jgi:hypothetical protein